MGLGSPYWNRVLVIGHWSTFKRWSLAERLMDTADQDGFRCLITTKGGCTSSLSQRNWRCMVRMVRMGHLNQKRSKVLRTISHGWTWMPLRKMHRVSYIVTTWDQMHLKYITTSITHTTCPWYFMYIYTSVFQPHKPVPCFLVLSSIHCSEAKALHSSARSDATWAFDLGSATKGCSGNEAGPPGRWGLRCWSCEMCMVSGDEQREVLVADQVRTSEQCAATKPQKTTSSWVASLGHSGDSKKYKIINHRYQFAYIIAQVRALVRGKKTLAIDVQVETLRQFQLHGMMSWVVSPESLYFFV